jgi:hypothetical protein
LKDDNKLSHETYEKVQGILIECDWKLTDYPAEEWYFSSLEDTRELFSL